MRTRPNLNEIAKTCGTHSVKTSSVMGIGYTTELVETITTADLKTYFTDVHTIRLHTSCLYRCM